METSHQVLLRWLWLWVAITSSSAARMFPDQSSTTVSVSVSDAAAGASWWSIASLAAAVLALTAVVVGAASLFGFGRRRSETTTRTSRRESSSSPTGRSSRPTTTTTTIKERTARSRSRERRPAAGATTSSRTRRGRQHPTSGGASMYEYSMLERETRGFDGRNAVAGRGRTGAVYRCRILGNDGVRVDVVVKRFHHALADAEGVTYVQRRVTDLAKKPHRNVVHTHGASVSLKRDKLCVVYAYMPKGSLHQHLFVRKPEGKAAASHDRRLSLTMAHRSGIIRDVALGLKHLHSHGILHGSVRATNILLEKDLTARVGDFGLFLDNHQPQPPRLFGSGSSSGGGGGGGEVSFVYVAPEWSPNTDATSEMDVFCFGAVVVEVVTGRQTFGVGDIPVDGTGISRNLERQKESSLVDWVWELHGRGCILDAVVDATTLQGRSAGGQLNRDVAKKLLLVGLACSHPDPDQRPTMENVVEMLQAEGARPPEVPPERPAGVIHTRAANN